MLSVAVVTVLSIFFFSFLASINSSVDQDLLADYQIDTGGFGFPTLSPELATRLEDRPEVAAASGVRIGAFAVEGDSHPVYGVDGADVKELFDLGLEEGSFDDLGADGFAVDRVTADEEGWRLGEELDVTFPTGTSRPMRIVAIYDNAGIIAQNSDGRYLLDTSVFNADFPAQNQFDARIVVRAAEGVDDDEARAAIDEVAAAFPSAEVRDRDGIKEEQNSQLYQSLGLLVVMLALSVLIGGLGITNTLALSVFERTREVGLLRAVGATRRQLRASIGYESVILTLFGTLMGMAIGVAGGAALISALSGTLIRATISVPIPFLVAVLVLAVIIGVLASLLPAWRAGRLDVLRAVAAE
jgi:putative ABC transport system permease protein